MLNNRKVQDGFSLSRVLELKSKTEYNELDTVVYLYKQAKLRVRDAYNNYLDYCYYSIPPLVPKLPPYNHTDMTNRVCEHLVKNKFKSKVINGRIYIEWKPKERPKDHIPLILKLVFSRIETSARNGDDYLFYEIPPILPEFPWYNTVETAEEIAKIIADKGFVVKILGSIIFVCWNKKYLETRYKVKINFETNEDKRKKAMEQIELINENRYKYFINPKRNKGSNIDFEVREPNKFDPSKSMHIYD